MQKKLKIVMVVGGFPNPEQPYRCIFNLRAAKQLSQFVDIEVITLRAWYFGRKRIQKSEVEGIPVYTVTAPQLPGSPLLNLAIYQYYAWPMVRPIIENCNLVHSVYADGPGIFSSSWAKRASKHHILQIIGSDVNVSLKHNINIRNFRFWHRYIHGVTANSNFLADLFSELYPEVKNIHTIYRGTDLSRFHANVTPEGPLASKAPVRFLYLGGFPYPDKIRNLMHIEKGGKYLLKAWKHAEKELNKCNASLALAGPNSDLLDYDESFQSMERKTNIHTLGPVHPEKIPGYISSSDIVVLPSLSEGLPNVAQEAMACGKALIGSSVGGLPELIDNNGATGYLVPPKDITALSEALIDAAQNPDRIIQMGITARQKAERLLDNRDFAPKVIDMYESILQEPLKKI